MGKWIPRPYYFKVLSLVKLEAQLLRVTDLIDKNNALRDRSMVNSLFLPIDVELILGTRLCSSWPSDPSVWHYFSTMEHIVKTTYHLIIQLKDRDALSSSAGSMQSFWKDVWSLHIPPRMKAFV